MVRWASTLPVIEQISGNPQSARPYPIIERFWAAPKTGHSGRFSGHLGAGGPGAPGRDAKKRKKKKIKIKNFGKNRKFWIFFKFTVGTQNIYKDVRISAFMTASSAPAMLP